MAIVTSESSPSPPPQTVSLGAVDSLSTHPTAAAAAAAGAEQGRDEAEDGAGVAARARPRTGAVPSAVTAAAALRDRERV